MEKSIRAIRIIAVGMVLPLASHAQSLADQIGGLQGVLEQLYSEMMPLCSGLIGVGRGLAGFAATWYIAARVWGHIARAEPVDFYPLFRPFAIGFAVLLFPSVIALINGVLQPTVSATASMVQGSDQAIAVLLKQKEEAIKSTDTWQMYVGETGSGDREKWYKYTHPEDGDGSGEGLFASIGNDIKFAMAKASYNFRNSIKQWLSEVLEVLYQAAALCINTLRTFFLIVLAILGPLVFGLSVFDGFGHTLTVWLARYINIFLWLPVANLFGAILGRVQEKMLALDLHELAQSGDTFFSPTDTAYLIFLIIGIVGYFCVPGVANYIVHAGGGSVLLQRVTSLTASGTQAVVTGGASMTRDVLGDGYGKVAGSMASFGTSGGYFPGREEGSNSALEDKISGK